MNRRDLLKRAVAVAAAPLAPIAQRFGPPTVEQIGKFGDWACRQGAAGWFLQNTERLGRGIRLMSPAWNQPGGDKAIRNLDKIMAEARRLGIYVRIWP